ncbi:hypothetical protein BC833DRAFT_582873, partial [Globomyces pollinis-pini]
MDYFVNWCLVCEKQVCEGTHYCDCHCEKIDLCKSCNQIHHNINDDCLMTSSQDHLNDNQFDFVGDEHQNEKLDWDNYQKNMTIYQNSITNGQLKELYSAVAFSRKKKKCCSC